MLWLAAGFGSSPPIDSRTPRIVVVQSGEVKLRSYLWIPRGTGPFPAVLFNHGSGDADPHYTSGIEMSQAAAILGQVFAPRHFVFLYLCRRGQGLSADQGPSMQDLLRREGALGGEDARRRIQFSLMTTDHLDDVLAGLAYLKSLPDVDRARIVVGGHSFGAQLTLLAAERDRSVKAAIMFGAAAMSWSGSSELRSRLLAAIDHTVARIMLVYAANDYSIAPGEALAIERARLGEPITLRILPRVGRTPEEGHAAVYTAVAQWKNEVFRFLERSIGS
jgi:dienelactone hydrolase